MASVAPSAVTSLREEPDLDELVHDVTEIAEHLDLPVMHDLPCPGQGAYVLLGPDRLEADQFVALAADAEARVLYVRTSEFHADETQFMEGAGLDHLPQSAAGQRDDLAALLRSARHHEGETCELDLAFAADGVLHGWIGLAPWYDRLCGQIDDLVAASDPDGTLDPAEEKALVDRLTEELLRMPQFRAARSESARRRVARIHHPEIAATEASHDDPRSWATLRAIELAHDRATLEAQRIYTDLAARLDTLAATLADDSRYASAGRASVRKHVAAQVLAERAQGYSPPIYIRDQLLDLAGSPQRRFPRESCPKVD